MFYYRVNTWVQMFYFLIEMTSLKGLHRFRYNYRYMRIPYFSPFLFIASGSYEHKPCM